MKFTFKDRSYVKKQNPIPVKKAAAQQKPAKKRGDESSSDDDELLGDGAGDAPKVTHLLELMNIVSSASISKSNNKQMY